MSNTSDSPLLTAAELLRRKRKFQNEKKQQQQEERKPDLDDEIRRLEQELQNSGSSDDSSSNSSKDDDDDDNDDDGDDSKGTNEEQKVMCLSSLKEDRIEPLPETLLPKTKRRILKNIDKDDDAEPERKRVKGDKTMAKTGLEAAVEQVLAGYKARSSEKLPFYCRVCAKQYSDEKSFIDHKESDFHQTAVRLERKASFCKLCRKQLTSPVQLQEHLKSRPHLERLQSMKQRQNKFPRNQYNNRRTPNHATRR